MSQELDALIVELKADISAFTAGLRGATKDITSFKNTGERQGIIKFSTDIRDLRSGIDNAQASIASLKLNTSRDRLLDVQADVRALASQLQAAASDVTRFGSAADKKAIVHLRAEMSSLQGQLGNATAEIDKFSRAGAASMMGMLKGGFLAVGGVAAAIGVGKEIFDTGVQLENLNNKMIAATGSAKAAVETIGFLRKESNRLGLDFLETANSSTIFITNMVKAGVPIKEARDIFIRFAEVGRAMGLTNKELDRTFYALGQTANVGKLRMEELGGQLGDVLPGALDGAARAMGVTKERLMEMVQSGEVKGIPFIKAFSIAMREGLDESVTKASNSAQANFARVNNSITELKGNVANGGFMFALSESFKAVTEAINTPALKSGLTIIGQIIGGVVIFVSQAIAGLAIMIEKVVELGKKAASINSGVTDTSRARGVTTNPDRPSSGAMGSKQTSFMPEMMPGNDMTASLDTGTMSDASMSGGASPAGGYGGSTVMGPSAGDDDPYTAFLQQRLAMVQTFNDSVVSSNQVKNDQLMSADQDYWSNAQSGLEGFLGIQLRTTEQISQESVATQAQNLRTTLQQAAQHNKTFFLLEKAAAIARALVSARESVVSAYNFGSRIGGPVLGATFAGIAAAAQAANIAAIASASYGGSGGGGGGSVSGGNTSTSGANQPTDSLGRSIQPATQVYITITGRDSASIPAGEVRQLIDQINEQQRNGSRVEVYAL